MYGSGVGAGVRSLLAGEPGTYVCSSKASLRLHLGVLLRFIVNAADIESYLDQPDQQPAPTTKTTKARGRQAAALKAKAAEEAAAAAEAAEAAAAAQLEADAAAQQEADAAADAAASASSDSETDEEDEGDELEGVDYGIIEDLAPYVILQLSDTEETRAIWPHKFDLYYKVGGGW